MEITEAELKAKIDAAVDAAVAGLKSKQTELLGKLTDAKKAVEAAEKAKADEVEAAVQAQLASEGKSEELITRIRENSKAQLEALQAKLDEANLAVTEANTNLQTLVIDKDLSSAFLEAGVTNPDLLEAAITLNSSKAEIVVGEDGKPSVTLAGLPVADFMKEWSEGKGKAFITDGNTGGGAGGDGGGGTDDYEQFFTGDTVNLTKQNELKQKDAARYEVLSKKYNKQDPLPLQASPAFAR